MKPTNSTLNALLASRQFIIANAYTFTLIDGTILRYTDGDQDIVYGGNTYSAGGQTGPYLPEVGNKPTYKWTTGIEVQTCTFDIIPKNATIAGIPFLSAVRLGMFDGAKLEIGRFYMATYGDTSAGLLSIFTGRVGQVAPGRIMCNFTINGVTELLSMNMPRNLYQAGCINTLFDTSCTLNQASFVVTAAATSGSTASVINASLGQATGYFALGKLQFTSGANNGFWRSIKSFTSGGVITLLSPLPSAPAISDTFRAYPGCDKMQSTCSGKFSNLVNFRGVPYLPENSTAV